MTIHAQLVFSGITEQLLSSGVMESSGSMNHLTSGIMAEVLRSRAQDTLLDNLTRTYAERAAALTGALRAVLPEGATVTETQGGFFCWLVLPGGVRADAVIAACVANELFPVSAIPGSNFSPSGSFGGCLRMAFTFYDAEQLAKAGTVVGEAVAKLSKKTAERKSD